MKIAVAVPTYHRPAALRCCLEALRRQRRAPDQVILVLRADDTSTEEIVARFRSGLPVTVITVAERGAVHALNAALGTIRADIVAFTDDDAAPREDWLLRIEQAFLAGPSIGAVGGRDVIVGSAANNTTVGRLEWFGRITGNHHTGVGGPRFVDTLKGANMSFRTSAISGLRFDEHLLGSGAQVHNDLAFCLAVRRRGWKLVYDPEIAVDHFPAPRSPGEERSRMTVEAACEEAHNLMLAVRAGLCGLERMKAQLWQCAVGSASAPGVARTVLSVSFGDFGAAGRWFGAMRGQLRAMRVKLEDQPTASPRKHRSSPGI